MPNVNLKSYFAKNDYCCVDHYKLSDSYKLTRNKNMDSFLKNLNIDISKLSHDEKLALRKKLAGEKTKNCLAKKHETLIKKYGSTHLAYSKAGNLSKFNKMLNFIKKYDLSINPLDLSNDEISKIYIQNFDIIKSHGKKIKSGLKNKYANVSLEYKNRAYKVALNHYGLDENLLNYSIDEIQQISASYNKEKKFIVSDKISWKKTHLINIGIDITNLTENDINILYSEYLVNRISKYDICIGSNFKSCKSGWYVFENLPNTKLFFRSSWEEIVLNELDNNILNFGIFSVDVPNPIEYFHIRKRKYFPDIEIILKNGTQIILEIKPDYFINLELNVIKLEAAKKQLNNFHVLNGDSIKNIKTELKIICKNE